MENGLRPCKHGRSVPRNATKLTDIENVVQFINFYAENNAILLPGRIPGYKRDDIQLLLSSTTKKVWQLYQQSATEMGGHKGYWLLPFLSLLAAVNSTCGYHKTYNASLLDVPKEQNNDNEGP